jgi:hypothetical protein
MEIYVIADTHGLRVMLWGSDDTKVYEAIIGMPEWNNLTVIKVPIDGT